MNCHDDSSSTIIDSNDGTKNLPNELLAKIFSTVTVANRWQDPWKLPSPALLSSVCSRWRIVAQNTPELWVNIIVPLHKSPEDCTRWTAEWITRSGILPISVMINDAMSRGVVPHLTNIIMGLLQQHSERLRHLALHSKHSVMIESAICLLRSAPNLQQLTIYSERYSSSWFQVENNSQRQYSLDFPRLSILKAQGLMVPLIPNLTSLTVGQLCASYHPISQYFTASPGLKHLTLRNLMPLVDPLPHDALIHADSLRSLAVSLHWRQPSPAQRSYIFKYLAMPNIKYLELDGDTWKASDFGQSLSFTKLDTLRISNRSELSFEVNTINFLHSFSTVRHLQLVHASTQGLLFKSGPGLTRKNSINFRNPSPRTLRTNLDITTAIRQKQSASTTVWPELRVITLDTLTAGDVLNLCDFVTCHKQLEVVELSTSARRHLSSSLRRKNDSVYQRPSLFFAAGSEEGSDDVEEWLGKMVDIRTFRSPSVGLLDAD